MDTIFYVNVHGRSISCLTQTTVTGTVSDRRPVVIFSLICGLMHLSLPPCLVSLQSCPHTTSEIQIYCTTMGYGRNLLPLLHVNRVLHSLTKGIIRGLLNWKRIISIARVISRSHFAHLGYCTCEVALLQIPTSYCHMPVGWGLQQKPCTHADGNNISVPDPCRKWLGGFHINKHSTSIPQFAILHLNRAWNHWYL